MKFSRVVFSSDFPKLSSQNHLIIYDKKLAKFSEFRNWLERYPLKLAVDAGEKLKDLDAFSDYVKKLIQLLDRQSSAEVSLVAVGGGSVGDFVGFLASVFKRGVELVHIPTTWLAAIDSAHGGKTALNVGTLKNQIGTFYPAQKILISKAMLSTQTSSQLRSAYGELFKIALISGGPLAKKVFALKDLDGEGLWPLLPMAVKAKLKVVKLDPYEKNKKRQLLNLGHTLGHALELETGISHGEAVLKGIEFALEWSRQRKYLKESVYKKIREAQLFKTMKRTPLLQTQLRNLLGQDKKRTARSKLNFIFVKRPGECILKETDLSEVLKEAQRQGWCNERV